MSAGRPHPTDAFLAAAVAGLFAGCSGDDGRHHRPHTTPTDTVPTTTCETDTETPGETGDTATLPTTTAPHTISVVIDTTIQFADFKAECDKRGGLIQTTAACAGNNACRGFSFNVHTKELLEHTCKAMNSCHGVSCVVLPEDKGISPQDWYEGSCGYRCHGPPVDSVMVLMPPGSDHEAELEKFRTTDRDYYVALVAFGNHGMNPNGTGSANAPFRTDEMSRKELGEIIDYMRSLPPVATEYGIVGITEEMNP